MKKMILAAAMAVSATSAFANMCEVNLINSRTGRVEQRISLPDNEGNCRESMKTCRLIIRTDGRYSPSRNDCVIVGDRNPGPQYPGPQYPVPGSDARRMINQGESVIFNNRYVTVAGVSFSGTFAVRSTDGWNTISNNIRRESLAVTNGCAMNICTSDSVIDVRMAKYVTVVGIHFDERVVTKSTDGWNTLTSNVDRMNLAETKGCINSRYSQICVGNQVINNMNRYSTVVGIQMDGRVVLRSSDGWNTLSTNIDPSSLVITR